MRLTELDPYFLKCEEQGDENSFVTVASIEEAQGIRFLCPKCFIKNNGAIGTHQIICWSRSRGAPEHIGPDGRWAINGTNMSDLSLDADPPSQARSVRLLGGCEWHGFVTNGEVT